MVSKVNLQARINRHSRVLKENLWSIHPFRVMYRSVSYNFVLILVIFLFPVYPLFSSFFYQNLPHDWDIDESSILDSYEVEEWEDVSLITSWDSFLSINTILDGNRDVSGYNEVIEYTIQSGDSLGLIAQKFGVSNNSILWANNFDAKKVIHPGEIIKIPPVSWLIHQVKGWDTLSQLAKQYKVEENKIIAQNDLGTTTIYSGQTLIIPWAIKEVPKPIVAVKQTPTKTTPSKTNTSSSSQWWYSFTSWGNSEFVNTNWSYQLVYRPPQWTFYWWNCTWYVAQYKDVNWSWNAKDWLRNAQSKGHATGSSPGLGAIVVFHGKWYNPTYWHVWIVVEITTSDIIVKDMNYRKLGEVTTRKVPKDDKAILGYIYVD